MALIVFCACQSDRPAKDHRYFIREALTEAPYDIHPQTVQMGIFDLAAILAALGRPQEAASQLVRCRGFDGWEIPYLRRDSLLTPAFHGLSRKGALARWVKQEGSANGGSR